MSIPVSLPRIALVVSALCIPLALAAHGEEKHDRNPTAGMAHRHAPGGDAGSMALHERMMQAGKRPMMQMSGDSDDDFVAMMIDHHQQAIAMAQIELRHGNDAAVKAMAKTMLDAQTREVREMKAWQAKHARR